MLKHICLLVGLTLLSACSPKATAPQPDVDNELCYCDSQIRRTLAMLAAQGDTIDYTMMPRSLEATDTAWQCRKATPDEWCSGFWPGVLWLDYEATGNDTLRREAERFTASLEYLSAQPVFDHDLGFQMLCSYGNAYRLTGNEHYRRVLLAAADTLATLYDPKAGTLLSWPRNVATLGGHNSIIDNMINLELLFWAAKNGGSHRLYDIAVSHAATTMAHQFRPDGSCYHVAVYDSISGKFTRGCNHQGFADESMWARGQAWAIYGFTMAYRETADSSFLDCAQRATEIYLKRLPADMVPYWDFDDPTIPDAPRDASAACIVASALLELSGYVDEATSARYRDAAIEMLATLSSEQYQSRRRNPSLLLHSVGNMPAGYEIDASIIYADYYYLEALIRLKNLESSR